MTSVFALTATEADVQYWKFTPKWTSQMQQVGAEEQTVNRGGHKRWMAYINKSLSLTISLSCKAILSEKLTSLVQSSSALKLLSQLTVTGKLSGTQKLRIPWCESTKRFRLPDYGNFVKGVTALFNYSVEEPSGNILQSMNTNTNNFCKIESIVRPYDLFTFHCTDLWTFHVDQILALHMIFRTIKILSTQFDCCKGNVVVSKDYHKFSSEAFFHQDVPDVFVFCGHHSKFNLYPTHQHLTISRHVEEHTLFNLSVSFQVQDKGVASIKPWGNHNKNVKIMEINWMSLSQQVHMSLHVVVQKNLFLILCMTGISSATVHDGPGQLSKQLQPKGERYQSSSFHCYVQLLVNDKDANTKQQMKFYSLKHIPDCIVVLNNSQISTTLVLNDTRININIVHVLSPPNLQINASITDIFYVGETDRISCFYGGVSAWNIVGGVEDEIASPVCESQLTHGVNYKIYSSGHLLALVRFWFQAYSYISVHVLLSNTMCKPIHINECKIDYLCHCSAVHSLDVCRQRFFKRFGPELLQYIRTTWPMNKSNCISYLEQEGRKSAGFFHFKHNPVEAGYPHVGTLLLNLPRENSCTIIKVQRTVTQLLDLRETFGYDPMMSACDLQIQLLPDDYLGTETYFHVQGHITQRPDILTQGIEILAFFGTPTSILPDSRSKKHKVIESPEMQSSLLHSKFNIPFLKIESRKKLQRAIKYFVKDKSPCHRVCFTVYVSLLSQLMGSWVDITMWKFQINKVNSGNKLHLFPTYNFSPKIVHHDIITEFILRNRSYVVKIQHRLTKPLLAKEEIVLKLLSLIDASIHKTIFYGRDKHTILFSLEFQPVFCADTLTHFFSFPIPNPFASVLTLVSPSLHEGGVLSFDLSWILEDLWSSGDFSEQNEMDFNDTVFGNITCASEVVSCLNVSSANAAYFLWVGIKYLPLEIRLQTFDLHSGRVGGMFSAFQETMQHIQHIWDLSVFSASWTEVALICKALGAEMLQFTGRQLLEEFVSLVRFSTSVHLVEAAFIGLKIYSAGVSIFWVEDDAQGRQM